MSRRPHTGASTVTTVAAVILAAGASRRLNRPKQLEPWRGRPLICHVTEQVVGARTFAAAVILGSRAREARQALDQFLPAAVNTQIETLENPLWRRGQSTSVRTGLTWARALASTPLKRPEPSGLLFIPVDQPFLSSETLNRLIAAHLGRSDRLIVPRYRDPKTGDAHSGAPVLWPRGLWHHLDTLDGDSGGRRFLGRLPRQEVTIDDPRQGMDLDTEEDLAQLRALDSGVEVRDVPADD